jgi:hypothetical protein
MKFFVQDWCTKINGRELYQKLALHVIKDTFVFLYYSPVLSQNNCSSKYSHAKNPASSKGHRVRHK